MTVVSTDCVKTRTSKTLILSIFQYWLNPGAHRAIFIQQKEARQASIAAISGFTPAMFIIRVRL